jgi:hypothetical protein
LRQLPVLGQVRLAQAGWVPDDKLPASRVTADMRRPILMTHDVKAIFGTVFSISSHPRLKKCLLIKMQQQLEWQTRHGVRREAEHHAAFFRTAVFAFSRPLNFYAT